MGESDILHNPNLNSSEKTYFNIPEITQDDDVEKDTDLQRVMMNDGLKMIEAKAQDLAVMLNSSKLYNIPGIIKKMNPKTQK